MHRWIAFLPIAAIGACGGRIDDSVPSDAGTDAPVAADVTPGACGVPRGTVVDVSEGTAPQAIAVDSTHVYWIATDRTLRRAPKQGGPAQDLAQNVYGKALALTASDVVFTTPLHVQRVPKSGGTRTRLGSFAAFSYAEPMDIVIVGDTNYLALFWGLEQEPGWVVRSPTDPDLFYEEIARGGATALAGDSTSLYVSFRNYIGGSIQRVPLDGSPPVVLATVDLAYELAIDEDTVYFIAGNPQTLSAVPKKGGAVTALATASGQIALDGTTIYWADAESMRVHAMPKKGGPIDVLASLDRGPWPIANDACWIYFGVDRGIVRVAK